MFCLEDIHIKHKKSKLLPLKVFIASPLDMKKAREISNNLFVKLNNETFRDFGVSTFWTYNWDINKIPGSYTSDSEFQDAVFEEFGDWCDIFILLVAKKIGEGTKSELNYVFDKFKKINKDCFIAIAHAPYMSSDGYGMIDPDLSVWLREIYTKHKIAPLGNAWEGLRDEGHFILEIERVKSLISGKMPFYAGL